MIIRFLSSLWGLLILSFFLVGCQKAILVSEQELSALSDSTLYYSKDSMPRIYYVSSNSNPGIFVTELDPKTAMVVPRAVYDSTDYGARLDPARPQDLKLILRSYNPKGNALTKEQYFETPILYSSFKISNVTTALSWILRWSFASYGNISVSYNLFDQLVKSVEVVCTDCRSKTSSQIVSLVLSNETLKSKIIQSLNTENPGFGITTITYSPPEYIYAYSYPNAALNGETTKDSAEASSIKLEAKILSPLNSQVSISPLKWVHEYNLVSTDFIPDNGVLTYPFNYAEAGNHKFTPYFDNSGTTLSLKMIVDVVDSNRIPLCDDPLVISVRENVRIQFDLKTKCRDLDVDEVNLAFSLVSGPSGLTISSMGQLEWTGKRQGSASNFNVDFVINDSKLGSKAVRANVVVTDDQPARFLNLPTSMSMTEGLGTLQTFRATDPDGDPIIVKIKPVTTVASGAPIGAGVLTDIVRTAVGSAYEFEWVFTPSWMQGIGTDTTMSLEFQLYYDPSDDSLNPAVLLASQVVNISISNTDDPPIWLQQPTNFDAVEGTALVNQSLGQAMDAPLSPTALSYTVRNTGGPTCDWVETPGAVSADGSGNILLNVTPAYNSAPFCNIIVVASDSNGMASESVEVTIPVEDTNRPVIPLAGAVTTFELKEGVVWNAKMETLFYDPDLVDEVNRDPREGFEGTCMVDTDLDGIYEKNCRNFNGANLGPSDLKVSVGTDTFAYFINPLPGLGGKSYNVELTVTDKGGVTATQYVVFNIAESPSTVQVEPSSNGSDSVSIVTANEGVSTVFYLKVSAASARAIDQYDYRIASPSCVKASGGACRAGFITSPSVMEGNGDAVFPFTLTPNYTEGDDVYPLDEQKYFIIFRIEKSDDAALGVDLTVPVTIKNVNRFPTALTVAAKTNESCTGSTTPDNGTTDHTICVDASKDTKSGSNWAKTYSVTFGNSDLDLTNDSYTYSTSSSKAPGSVTTNKWGFKLPACISAGYTTVTRSFTFLVEDGRGGTVSRTIVLKIQKAQTSGSCM